MKPKLIKNSHKIINKNKLTINNKNKKLSGFINLSIFLFILFISGLLYYKFNEKKNNTKKFEKSL